MAPRKTEKSEMSAFERKRLENIAANQAMLKDLSTSAARINLKPLERPNKGTVPREKKSGSVKKEKRPTRFSSRIAGIEADTEVAKRKAEIEFSQEQLKVKKQRVTGELNFADIIVDNVNFSRDSNFLSDVRKGAQPYMRTFTEDDIKKTTSEDLRELREKMNGLKLYEAFEPNRK